MDRFPYAFDPRFRVLLRLIGASDRDAVVLTDDDRLVATFGPFRVDTPLSNVIDTSVTRDYRWYKAIGARGSIADRGLTFGTNTRAGACIRFREPVAGLLGPKIDLHPGLTVTVADPEAFVTRLQERLART